MIPLTWLPLLRKFGPWVLVALLIGGIYLVGRSHGSNKWEGKYNIKVVEYNKCVDTATHSADEVVKLQSAIDLQNEAYSALERSSREHLDAVNAVHQRALANQASSYQRAIREAREATDDLRSRIEILSVAETCHEAWLEVAND